jgi:transcription initiation factor TFIIIB Brf1 subunit/transcription initiation factor TFIIB
MEIILCPYCECKVNMNDVDDEGGVCPECGALITGSLLYEQEDDLDALDEEAVKHKELNEEENSLDDEDDDL